MPIYGPGGPPGVTKSELSEFKEEIDRRFDRVEGRLEALERDVGEILDILKAHFAKP